MTAEEVASIPRDRTVTYARIVCDYWPQKKDPNRVRITEGGNLINYPYKLTTRTADLITTKLLWNSVISTPGARYMCIDIKNMYLMTPMKRREYMRIPIDIVPDKFIRLHNLRCNIHKGYLYMEIQRGMYGLPQAGKIANTMLKEHLAKGGYYEVPHTPGLFKHFCCPVQFTLVVDNFGVKYTRKEDAIHLITELKKLYDIEIDWSESTYAGMNLSWNYNKGYVDVSMPGYVEN